MLFYHAVGELMLLLNTQLQEQALCNWYRPTKSIMSTATHDVLISGPKQILILPLTETAVGGEVRDP